MPGKSFSSLSRSELIKMRKDIRNLKSYEYGDYIVIKNLLSYYTDREFKYGYDFGNNLLNKGKLKNGTIHMPTKVLYESIDKALSLKYTIGLVLIVDTIKYISTTGVSLSYLLTFSKRITELYNVRIEMDKFNDSNVMSDVTIGVSDDKKGIFIKKKY